MSDRQLYNRPALEMKRGGFCCLIQNLTFTNHKLNAMKKLLTLLALALHFCVYAQPGALDTTFNTGTGPYNSVFAINLQGDGKIIIGGQFMYYNGMALNKIARLHTDGSIDTTFNTGTGANYSIKATALQSDGRIIIGGGFTTFNGSARNGIARLHSDGSLDATFNPGMGIAGTYPMVSSIALQSDGKIIISGVFVSYNGTARKRIARLNTDGSLDATFNSANGADSTVSAIALQSDGKIIIGGDFSSYNGTPRNNIARLNTDGSLDTTFNPGTGLAGTYPTVSAIARQSDGKILIGGVFDTYNGTAINRIARLHTDGSLDTTFNPGTGANDQVFTIAVQGDGKIFIGGFFTTYNGTARKCIARLNADGSLDTSFYPGMGADYAVYVTAFQNDGKILIGGGFNNYNGIPRNNLVRVLGGLANSCTGTIALYTLYPDTVTAGNWWAVNQATSANPLSYSWAWGDGNFSTGATPSHTYAVAGNYYICLTVSDTTGCTDTYCDSSTYIFKTEANIISVSVVYQIPTGIKDFGRQNADFGLNPNPATESVRISIDESMIGSSLSITDMTGRRVAVVQLSIINQQVSIANLAKGVYIITVEGQKGRVTKKLVKQ